MVIREDTSIEQLRDAGILPDFIYRDCEEHGMYEAENVLNEWDWEWDWDLGQGYNDEQLEILKQIRKTISDGIKAFHNNPAEVKRYKEEREREKQRDKLNLEYWNIRRSSKGMSINIKFLGLLIMKWPMVSCRYSS